MRPPAKINQRAAPVYRATTAIGNPLLNEVKLVWTVLKHPDQIGLGHEEALETLFLLDDRLG
jgi:hypothetical protein